MEQYDLNQIRGFVRLVQAGSFTKAGQILKQPKSRVSRHLAALERSLGMQLIYRTTRQFQLTDAGRAFYERAKGLVEGLESLSAEVQETTSEVSGVIKVTAADDMGVNYLPPILAEFTNLYPQIRFEVSLSQQYVDLVKESIDVAIRIGHLKDSSLRVRKVGVIRNIFVASPGFIERYKQVEDAAQLEQVPFVSMTTKVEFWRGSESKKQTLKPQAVIMGNNPAFLLQMAILGKGVAFVPEFICAPHIQGRRLVHLHKNLSGLEVPVSVVTPEQKEVPLKIRKFTEFAAKRLREMFV